ncbi:hypothetical protein WOLCODRAFT_149874 [Wolfiporia cocos MD-104 SS10]|uniref:F-box domain-containing protein n=1 Tax=Wolfiporia cocos (strain MD-104) TaxID=742152 RepID=A0A2H3JT15_WOLCO|nr:hypothetical protein WOLCODRAFT_149874 [Wolfiporia cocos MD-104 SS10]
MQLFSINEDVLQVILSLLLPDDLLQLALTCRHAYSLIVPCRILAEVALTHGNEIVFNSSFTAETSRQSIHHTTYIQKRTAAFCEFVLADPARASHLRVLKLSGDAIKPWTFDLTQPAAGGYDWSRAGPMIRVLEHATHLRELHLYNLESLARDEPAFCAALAALASLQRLVLAYPGPHLLGWLARPHAPLRLRALEVKAAMPTPQQCAALCAALRSPAASERLHTLRVRPAEMLAGLLDAHAGAGAAWPTVRVLELHGDGARLPAFARAFPRVRSLHLRCRASGAPTDAECAEWPELDTLTVQESADVLVAGPVRRLQTVAVHDEEGVRALIARTSPREVVDVSPVYLPPIEDLPLRTAGAEIVSVPHGKLMHLKTWLSDWAGQR